MFPSFFFLAADIFKCVHSVTLASESLRVAWWQNGDIVLPGSRKSVRGVSIVRDCAISCWIGLPECGWASEWRLQRVFWNNKGGWSLDIHGVVTHSSAMHHHPLTCFDMR